MELYRYDDINHGDSSAVWEQRIPVIRETPKCYVVHSYTTKSRERFVLKDPNGKRYAHNNKADAWKAYQIRKDRHVKWMQSKLDHALRCKEHSMNASFEEYQEKNKDTLSSHNFFFGED